MKCELCHKTEATTVLHRPGKDGADEELYVCAACAKKHAETKPKEKTDGEHDKSRILFPQDKPPPFVENLLKATLGFVQGVVEAEKAARHPDKNICPVCGRSREDVLSSHRLGCPACWKLFADDVRNHMLENQYGSRHVGRTPPVDKGGDARAYLERQLKAAIRKEAYEKAAEIKRKLVALDAPGKEQP